LCFALLLVLLLRPLAVLLTVPRRVMPPSQRRLVAWFGIRGVGTLFYLVFVLTEGVSGDLAETLIGAALCCVAVSIVLHGVSATPLMAAYHGRQLRRARPRTRLP
jgi:NhaP-type Na+/H+ or K+/H+ antiporter